jgi:hypothetical protein
LVLSWLLACSQDIATGTRCTGSAKACSSASPDAGPFSLPSSAGAETTNGHPIGAGGAAAGAADDSLHVRVEDSQKMTIKVVTLTCSGDCADVEAVAEGGHAPYTFRWEDGSTAARRQLCPNASTQFSVSATDTQIDSSEFAYAAHTATASVTANVLDCAGASIAADGGMDTVSVYWTTWTSVTNGSPGSADGTLSPPGGMVHVAYTGEAVAPSAITGQPSTLLIGVVTFTPVSTFQSSTVTNAPPPSGMLSLSGDAMLTQTIRFSVPVRDPLIAVMSLGNFVVASTWKFDAMPVVLSTGPGIANQNGTLTASGQLLTGAEGNGVVQFSGTFTSLSFTVPAPEMTAQFTVGIRGRG